MRRLNPSAAVLFVLPAVGLGIWIIAGLVARGVYAALTSGGPF